MKNNSFRVRKYLRLPTMYIVEYRDNLIANPTCSAIHNMIELGWCNFILNWKEKQGLL